VSFAVALALLLLSPAWTAAQAPDWESLTASGDLYFNQGHYNDAARSYDQALTALEKVVSGEDPRLIGALNRLGLAWRSMGQAHDAEPLFRRAMSIAEKSLGPEAPALAPR
jgi:tetratricopeptide (TPR) repeat protein